ncbi:aspartate/glutamate racemase family protein [Cohnella lupini]|uniref:Aspartate racemase n=1 Tax=Cohnella lupini TaxID=1294267 RepID=A0A3D9IX34_9BACL|nr:amino acid racemase [Cohnella lupini]RED66302.1 aspartate racemase [Cohnella lupini]
MKPLSLGILGGMGPQATALFMERVIQRTKAKRDQDHLDMVVLNHASLPDRTDAVRSGQGGAFLEEVRQDFKLLELADVANIAIPCNTSHYYYEEMQRMTRIPIIHMVQETIRRVYERCGPGVRVGLLATEGTVQSGVYAQACEKYRLKLVLPTDLVQRKVSGIIYDQVKRDRDLNPQGLTEVIEVMINTLQCDLVVLACTELSCLPIPPSVRASVVDAMDVLAEQSVIVSGGTIAHSDHLNEEGCSKSFHF